MVSSSEHEDDLGIEQRCNFEISLYHHVYELRTHLVGIGLSRRNSLHTYKKGPFPPKTFLQHVHFVVIWLQNY